MVLGCEEEMGKMRKMGEYPSPYPPSASCSLLLSLPLLFVGNWNYFGWGEQQSKYSV